ncbi:hypothetical protein SPSPH_045600 [Sporomusa sphaeroides DSM 2875]|uniref:Uncharacterized protein n=1 Tax=Sporomusa sphaeroides DSM 2875 TaxID=1337886 RepID=A0ABM9W012_9FIRM|nr:hypothetical protein SPSPH_27860 [Sporomusa sphaeroides DSM 2875]CVK18488.1 hypothetical protein SSPH_01126 [Sporomusa sphaeroides DSM 2875]
MLKLTARRREAISDACFKIGIFIVNAALIAWAVFLLAMIRECYG